MQQSEEFKKQYGPWALVAGGAQGIGLAYALWALSAEEWRSIIISYFTSNGFSGIQTLSLAGLANTLSGHYNETIQQAALM